MPVTRNEGANKAATRSDPTGQPRSRGGNKPVECPICHKVLNRKPDLNRHMLIHKEDADRLTCHFEGCSFTTIQRSNLNTHLATHTGERKHACPDCSYRTTDPAALTRHRKRIHQYVPRSRRKMPNNKGKQPAVPSSSTCLEQQQHHQPSAGPVAGPSTMLVPATFTPAPSEYYSSSPSPSPSRATSSERYYSSEAVTYSHSSPAGSVETGDDYYPSPLNSEDEAAAAAAGTTGGSRDGSPSSVSSASSSGSAPREVSITSQQSRNASPTQVQAQAQAGPSTMVIRKTNLNSCDEVKEEEANADWLQEYDNKTGGRSSSSSNSVWCVGSQQEMWMLGMTDGFAQDSLLYESNLFLPSPTPVDIGGMAWDSNSDLGFGHFNFNPMVPTIPVQAPKTPEPQGKVKIQQQAHTNPYPSPPTSSRSPDPIFYQDVFGSTNSWF